MARLEDPRGRLELDLDLGRDAGLERDGCVVAVAVREVEQPAAGEGGGAVGKDVAELGRDVRDGHGRGDGEPHARVAHHVEIRGERLPVVGEREGVVDALVVRQSPRELPGAGDPRRPADVAADVDRVGALALRPQHLLGEPLRRPRRLARATRRASRRDPAPAASSGGRTPRSAAPRRRRSPRRRASGGTSGSAPARGRCAAPAARWPSSRGPTGPRITRFGHASASKPRNVDVRVAVGPAGDDHRRAGDPARSPGRTEPCRQYGPSTCSSSQRSSHGSASSTRRSHCSRQPAPNTAGTGGSALPATM